jgi:transcriptional regulator with XRE-family HTH domain
VKVNCAETKRNSFKLAVWYADNILTQAQLAEKTGTKKSFISRIENGHSDIQLSTLYKLLEYGLGRKITLTIQ